MELQNHGYVEFHTMLFVLSDCDISEVEVVSDQ